MAVQSGQRALFEALVAKYGKKIADAFINAINDLRANVDLQLLVKALAENDINAAESALHLDQAALAKLRTAITETYDAGGQTAVSGMPVLRDAAGAKLVIRFDPGHQRAEQWLKEESSTLIKNLIDPEPIRDALAAGMRAGSNPLQTALDLVGRVDRASGKRTGGLIGLSRPQAEYLQSAQEELASTDPKLLRNYLARNLRDRRYDKSVLKAIESGEPIPVQTQQSAAISYSNRLLKARADLIGKQESFAALETAKAESYQQVIDRGAVAQSAVRKKWHHFANEHPRLQHIAMNGTAVGISQRFILPDGTAMRFPHDPSAPIRQTAGCYCQADYKIDFLAGAT